MFQKPGGPKSLTLGSDAAENRRQIGAFSPSFSVSDPEAESVPDTAFVTALEKVCQWIGLTMR